MELKYSGRRRHGNLPAERRRHVIHELPPDDDLLW
jgi:hypothetical protein